MTDEAASVGSHARAGGTARGAEPAGLERRGRGPAAAAGDPATLERPRSPGPRSDGRPSGETPGDRRPVPRAAARHRPAAARRPRGIARGAAALRRGERLHRAQAYGRAGAQPRRPGAARSGREQGDRGLSQPGAARALSNDAGAAAPADRADPRAAAGARANDGTARWYPGTAHGQAAAAALTGRGMLRGVLASRVAVPVPFVPRDGEHAPAP